MIEFSNRAVPKLKIQNWRKIMVLSAFAFVFFFLPVFALAVPGIGGDPLIPCGLEGQDPCNFCHFFQLAQNIYNFIIFVIAPPIAVILVAVGAFFWLSAGGSEGQVTKGRKILIAVALGLVIIYVSWLLVSFVINLIASKNVPAYNPAKWYDPTTWFSVQCGAPSNSDNFSLLMISPSSLPDTYENPQNLTISGKNLPNDLRFELVGPDFSFPLNEETVNNQTQAQGNVLLGLPPGIYTLQATALDGRTAQLASAFTVFPSTCPLRNIGAKSFLNVARASQQDQICPKIELINPTELYWEDYWEKYEEGGQITVEILGANFKDGSTVRLIERGDKQRPFHELTNVAYLSSMGLEGALPAGMPSGAYDVEVFYQGEKISEKIEAFELKAELETDSCTKLEGEGPLGICLIPHISWANNFLPEVWQNEVVETIDGQLDYEPINGTNFTLYRSNKIASTAGCPCDIIVTMVDENAMAMRGTADCTTGVVIIPLYEGVKSNRLVHELGHGIGCLLDEYIEDSPYSEFAYFRLRNLVTPFSNCSLSSNKRKDGLNPCDEWHAIGASYECKQGCNHSENNFFRDSENDLMNNHYEATEFGPVDKYILNQAIAQLKRKKGL